MSYCISFEKLDQHS